MTTITCLLATVLAVLTVPLLLLWRLTLSPQQRIHRLRSNGWSQARIAEHLGISRYAVRKALA